LCKALMKQRTCFDAATMQKCNSKWVVGPWSACPCGNGTGTVTRSVTCDLEEGFATCPTPQPAATMSCDNSAKPCPINCELGEWTVVSSCSRCGTTTSQRRQSIVVQGAYGGKKCPSLQARTLTEPCQPFVPCKQDCVGRPVGWEDNCNATCGVGFQRQKLVILQPAFGGGRECTYARQQCRRSSWLRAHAMSRGRGLACQSRRRAIASPARGLIFPRVPKLAMVHKQWHARLSSRPRLVASPASPCL